MSQSNQARTGRGCSVSRERASDALPPTRVNASEIARNFKAWQAKKPSTDMAHPWKARKS